ncbi:kinase-like domain-containing protein [Hypoxylon trugodes]|uniref:kinase-like domain-containing protein n=1 Tax=Hypoxylon trugodes TaxID=326681 RepID=UPI00219BB9C3|nr:kinase-like domain-containing protein [Hypoxylon trugodes]KAI1390064.1 kinase-like domain-containing protein [Hypoxylon trugodes]
MASAPYPAPPGARGVLGSSEPLPLIPQEITTEWCTKVLGHKVKTIAITKEIHATASKLLADIVYEDGTDTSDAPTKICIKGGFNPALTSLYPALFAAYRREAEFYFYLAPIVDLNLPQVWYNSTDTVSGQGIIVMSDLIAQGCEFGEPLKPWPVERVRVGVEELAKLHAKTWGAPEDKFPWLAGDKVTGGNPLQGMIISLLSPEAWEIRFKKSPAPPLPEVIADRERMLRAFKTMWATANPKLRAIQHGDSHVGNTFIAPDGRPGFIDWQAPFAGVNLQDVAYFVIGALTIEERRKHEADLLGHYLRALHVYGGPKFEKEDVWHDYRKHALHGLAWSLTAPGMQPDENIFVMTERHAAAVEDHKTFELLESLPEYVKG